MLTGHQDTGQTGRVRLVLAKSIAARRLLLRLSGDRYRLKIYITAYLLACIVDASVDRWLV